MNWQVLTFLTAMSMAGCGNAGDAAAFVTAGVERCPEIESDGVLSPDTIQKMVKNPPPILNALHNPERLERELKNGANPNLCVFGSSLLSLPAMEGDIAILDLLLKHGAKPDRPENFLGGTPLMIALQRGHFDAAATLIRHGANPLHMTDAGLTTLHQLSMAEFRSNREFSNAQLNMALHLIKAGVNVNAQHRVQHDTPLNGAVIRRNLPLVAFLLEQGANPDLKNRQGHTALTLAKKRNYMDIADLLETYSARNAASRRPR